MFYKLYKITLSSSAHRTESASAMSHELFVATSSTVLDSSSVIYRPNIYCGPKSSSPFVISL